MPDDVATSSDTFVKGHAYSRHLIISAFNTIVCGYTSHLLQAKKKKKKKKKKTSKNVFCSPSAMMNCWSIQRYLHICSKSTCIQVPYLFDLNCSFTARSTLLRSCRAGPYLLTILVLKI